MPCIVTMIITKLKRELHHPYHLPKNGFISATDQQKRNPSKALEPFLDYTCIYEEKNAPTIYTLVTRIPTTTILLRDLVAQWAQ